MFTFDLQRFDDLKQGLRNIVVGHMNNIDNTFLHKESLSFTSSDVTDVMSAASLSSGQSSGSTTKIEPNLYIPYYWDYDYERPVGQRMYWTYEYDGDGQIIAWGDNGSYSGGGMYSLADVYKGVPLEVDTTNHRIYFQCGNVSVAWGIYVYATEGERYAAKEMYFEDSE